MRCQIDPDSDAPRAAFALDVEGGQCGDHPVLKGADMGPDIPRLTLALALTLALTPARPARQAPFEIKHDIRHALPRPVIGIASAAPGPVDRKPTRIQHLRLVRAGPGGKKRGVLEKPDEFGQGTVANGGYPLLHGGESRLVGHRGRRHAPLHARPSRAARPTCRSRCLKYRHFFHSRALRALLDRGPGIWYPLTAIIR